MLRMITVLLFTMTILLSGCGKPTEPPKPSEPVKKAEAPKPAPEKSAVAPAAPNAAPAQPSEDFTKKLTATEDVFEIYQIASNSQGSEKNLAEQKLKDIGKSMEPAMKWGSDVDLLRYKLEPITDGFRIYYFVRPNKEMPDILFNLYGVVEDATNYECINCQRPGLERWLAPPEPQASTWKVGEPVMVVHQHPARNVVYKQIHVAITDMKRTCLGDCAHLTLSKDIKLF